MQGWYSTQHLAVVEGKVADTCHLNVMIIHHDYVDKYVMYGALSRVNNGTGKLPTEN